jgi:pre-mRNA-splicing factor CDC5/CEF1
MPASHALWTNVEDSILQASISKYGLNQWSRVSSLLARKSAKQCKARWEEFLSPAAKKGDWSQAEDEQLLHVSTLCGDIGEVMLTIAQLAKIFSSSWRTIASIIGRSAHQCITRYDALLNQAEQKEHDELGLTGDVAGDAAAPEEVTKMQREAYPEASLPLPDAVDMDEEEKEMLSEARARLANTQGKKAKRKARERMLEESRRVAQLQKRRELKMSGINIRIRTNKKGEMDYNADVPFQHNVPRGMYDVEDEEQRNEREKASFDPKRQQLANKRKGDQEDDGEDRKRKKFEKKDGPSVSAAAMQAAKQQKIREAERSSMRKALNLPAPQITEGELEEVVKMGKAGDRANRGAQVGENDATRGLVGSYTNMPAATPIRTPRAAPEEDRIANEIRNIQALNQTQSAILGGDAPDVSGTFGMEENRQQFVTPNPMATPLRQANGVAATPGKGPGATPLRTPRDSFNLNKQIGVTPVGQTPREVRQQQQSMRNGLLAKLAALPKPKAIEYELETPEEQLELESVRADLGEDASVRDARDKLLRDAAELAEFKRQTQVVQRRLPRPVALDIDLLMKDAEAISDSDERAVAIETALLIANDAVKFGGARVTGATRPLRVFDDEDLHKARELVLLELSSHDARKEKEAFSETWTELHAARKLPGLDGYAEDDIDEHQLMIETFDKLEDAITATASKGNELEKKLAKTQGGYQVRAKMLRAKIVETAEALEKVKIGLNDALSAQVAEDAAVVRRLERLREEVGVVSRREREAQEEYRRVKEELDELPVTNGYH